MEDYVEKIFGIIDCNLVDSKTAKSDKYDRLYTLQTFEYIGEQESVCPNCGEKLYSHGKREINLVDVPQGSSPVRWSIKVPRRRCPSCKYIWQPTIQGIDETRKLTNRAFLDLTKKGIRDSFENTADDYMLSANTVKNVFVDFLELHNKLLQFKTPAFIGIDEIKIKKLGEVTVITDLEHRTLFDMLLGRNQKTLTEYFMNLSGREEVQWVCSDMYRPFKKSIGDAMPNARWTIDHFHVVMKANEAVDAVRRTMQDSMRKQDRIKTKRGLAYTLKTRLSDLTVEEFSKMRYARQDEALKPLAEAYDLKEDFFNIYDDNPASKEDAQKAFDKWEKSIPENSMYDKFRELANTVHNFYEQIFNAWDCPIAISNGFTECTNRLIRENNCRGRGYSFEVLRGRTLYRKTNLQRSLAGGLTVIGPAIPKNEPVFHFDGASEEINEDNDDYEPFPGERF